MFLLSVRQFFLILTVFTTLCVLFPKFLKAEMRFCYEGHAPHKILENDCPGGFIAFKPLKTSCLYYAKGSAETPELGVKFSSNMCDDSADIQLYSDGDNDFTGIGTFHSIFFEVIDEAKEPFSGAEVPLDICAVDCLSTWKDPFMPSDAPRLIQVPSLPPGEKQKLEEMYKSRAKSIFIKLSSEQNLFESAPESILESFLTNNNNVDEEKDAISTLGSFLNIIKLFVQSVKITISKCAPFVNAKFYLQVIKAMLYLIDFSSFPEINPHSFKTIAKKLQQCLKTRAMFHLNGTSCGETSTLNTISFGKETWKYQKLPRSFHWGIYDPIIEAAWVAVDFVHGFCFQFFEKDPLHFHLYLEGMAALFPREIQLHWMHPVQLEEEFWNAIMDTNDIKTEMRNLDGCATAAYMDTSSIPFSQRLLRPFLTEEQVLNPVSATEEDLEERKPWKKSIFDYWKWYNDQGGFKEASKYFGYCLDGSQEHLNNVTELLKEKGLEC